MYLDNSKQEAKYGFFISRVKCKKHGDSIASIRWKLPGKVHVRNVELLEW